MITSTSSSLDLLSAFSTPLHACEKASALVYRMEYSLHGTLGSDSERMDIPLFSRLIHSFW